jgi:hypothetical protein
VRLQLLAGDAERASVLRVLLVNSCLTLGLPTTCQKMVSLSALRSAIEGNVEAE